MSKSLFLVRGNEDIGRFVFINFIILNFYNIFRHNFYNTFLRLLIPLMRHTISSVQNTLTYSGLYEV